MRVLYKLEAVNTEHPNGKDVRYRAYTTSLKAAKAFERIPKIQFTDSGHGIIFQAIKVTKRDEPEKTGTDSCYLHVDEHWKKK